MDWWQNFDWEASQERSKERCKPPTGRAAELLVDLNESKHLWYALRRHGDEEMCIKWLDLLRDTSTHDPSSENEVKRKQYLKLLDEIKRWQPDFQDR